MTITTNARVAGVTYFVYLAAGMSSMATAGNANAANVTEIFMSLSALVLGVTLRFLEAAPGEGYVYFAVGNAIFCWLLLRGRLIPVGLAWLGVLGSIVLIATLLLQRAGVFAGADNWSSNITWMVSLPTLIFELAFAVWLLTRGVPPRLCQP
jgi:hypothetical protein